VGIIHSPARNSHFFEGEINSIIVCFDLKPIFILINAVAYYLIFYNINNEGCLKVSPGKLMGVSESGHEPGPS